MADSNTMEYPTPPGSLNIQIPNAPRRPSALSPETPSSMFGKTILEESNSSVVLAIVLSHWDNILGPRIRHLWYIKSLENHTNTDTLHYIANHTLSGEICRDPGDSNIDCKFYVLRDRNLVVTSFLFNAMDKGDLVVHSLSVIVLYKDMHVFLNWQQLTRSWMHRGVAKLRILLDKSPETLALSKFSHCVSEFVSMFQSIREAPVPRNIPISDTAFQQQNLWSTQFLHKALLCHITTCGRSVVIGKSPGSINVMIATLSMFLRAHERLCCRYVSADKPWSYHPDLCVQGLLLTEGEELGSTLKNIYFSQYPTTLVDLLEQKVKVSSLVHKHRKLRHQAISQELQALWKAHNPSYPTSDMFQSYDEPDTLMTEFLMQMYQMPGLGGNREALVQKFMQSLEKKAVTLIKYVEISSNCGLSQMTSDQQKQMKQELSLTLPGDFNAVLAMAEKLKPDIYSMVCAWNS